MPSSDPERLPKIAGADIELGNFLLGHDSESGTGPQASRLLLRFLNGIPGSSFSSFKTDPQDFGRKWLGNGSCCYIDLDHLEMALPEVTNAWDFTAALHAQLRIVRAALRRAHDALPPGVSLHALACNSDGSGSSWGSHLNFLVTRRCYENIFHRRLHYLLWLASFHASSVLVTGQGKAGAENGAGPVDYQLGQRADFLEEIVGLQTTFRRPIVNSRDETLCGESRRFARLHHIASDMNLCHVANVLKVGSLQILLAMIENESPQIGLELILQDPVQAGIAFSHAPELDARQPTLAGEAVSALNLQRRFHEAAAAFVATGACAESVPRAEEILALWADTLDRLAARDWDALSRRLDWALKLRVLQEALQENPHLSWQSPEIKRLDLLYGSLDPDEGIYWSLEAADCVERLVPERQILRFVTEPPSDTRAYTRAHLLRAFGREGVVEVNWDRMVVRARPERGYYGRLKTIHLDDPAGFTRARTGGLFPRHHNISGEAILMGLAPAVRDEAAQAAVSSGWPHTNRDSARKRSAFDGIPPWR